MQTALAFLQSGADAVECVAAPILPVASPRPGRPAIFAPPFSLAAGEPCWFDFDPASHAVLSREQWRRRFPVPATGVVSPAWGPPDQGRFAAAVRSLAGRFATGTLKKGVPVAVMSAPVGAEQADLLFSFLLNRVPSLPRSLSAYGFYRPASDTGTGCPEFLVGATPEMLFDLDETGRLSTVAIAGTRRAGGAQEGLDASVKDREEHQAVVDDILARLADWGQPEASEVEVRSFGELEHLVVDIRLDAPAALEFEAVARRLHPTPALGVHPRGPAGTEWLAGIDPRGDRNRFGAPFGIRRPSGAGRCLVAIRNLQYRNGRLDLWAGCGVVAKSRYEDEWREILDKMQAVRALWGV